MDRKTFSEQLVNQRESAKVGKNEICRMTGFTFLQLQRIEGASNNYKMDLVIKYLEALGKKMVLTKDQTKKVIKANKDIADWLKQARKDIFTQRSLADAIESSFVVIANLERGFRQFHIDMFLKLIDTLNYNIKIEKK